MKRYTYSFEEAKLLQKEGYEIVCFSYFVNGTGMLITLEKPAINR